MISVNLRNSVNRQSIPFKGFQNNNTSPWQSQQQCLQNQNNSRDNYKFTKSMIRISEYSSGLIKGTIKGAIFGGIAFLSTMLLSPKLPDKLKILQNKKAPPIIGASVAAITLGLSLINAHVHSTERIAFLYNSREPEG